MKSIKQLRKLANNPFFTMSDEEVQALKAAEANEEQTRTASEGELRPKKGLKKTKGAAAVKETGKLNKHSSDPVKE